MGNQRVDPAYIVLDNFLKSLPGPKLKCRARHGHRFPDWTDTKKTKAFKERRTGVVMLEGDCEEGCGTIFRKLIGPDGVIEYSATGRSGNYDYEEDYRLPAECREIPTREILAAARTALISRRPARSIKLVDELPIMARKRERLARELAKAQDATVRMIRPPSAG